MIGRIVQSAIKVGARAGSRAKAGISGTGAGAMRKVGAMGLGFGVIDGTLTYNARQKDNPNESKLKSGAIAVGTAAAWELFTLPMVALTAAGFADDIGRGMTALNKQHQARYYNSVGTGSIGSGTFRDNDAAYTMRQRSMQAISQSRLNARSALGNEARSLHH